MALTREEALKRARDMAAGAGQAPDTPISEEFIRELMGDPTADVAKIAQTQAGITRPGADRAATTRDSLADIQKRAQLKALGARREAALGTLTAEQERIAPAFREQRTAIGVGRQREARGFGEFLAQRGLAAPAGGAAAQAEIARGVTEQAALGRTREQEMQIQADIERRRTGAEREFALGREQAELGRLATVEQARVAQEQAQAQAQAQIATEQRALQNQVTLRSIDAEIAEARATNDLGREQQLLQAKAGIEREQTQLQGQLRLQQIGATGAQARTTAEFRAGLEPEAGIRDTFSARIQGVLAHEDPQLALNSIAHLLTPEELKRADRMIAPEEVGQTITLPSGAVITI